MVWPSPLNFISKLYREVKALLKAALTDANRVREEKILKGTKYSQLSPHLHLQVRAHTGTHPPPLDPRPRSLGKVMSLIHFVAIPLDAPIFWTPYISPRVIDPPPPPLPETDLEPVPQHDVLEQGSETSGNPLVGAKAKTSPSARGLRRGRRFNRDKTTGEGTLRPIRHQTKTCTRSSHRAASSSTEAHI
jgi:hypothetical protein